MKILYSWTKELSNERQTHSVVVKGKNGNILSVEKSKTKRWYEHLNEVLNREKPSNPVSIPEIEAPAEIEKIDVSEPTRAEKNDAKKQPKNGKTPGIDNVRAELLKADIDFVTIKSKEIIDIVWREERTPGKCRKGLRVKSWRRFTLLPVVSKVKGKIVIERSRSGVKAKLRKDQAGSGEVE